MSAVKISLGEGLRYILMLAASVIAGVAIPVALQWWGLGTIVLASLLVWLLSLPAVRVARVVRILIWILEIVIPAFFTHYIVKAFDGYERLDAYSPSGVTEMQFDWSAFCMALGVLTAAIGIFVVNKVVNRERRH